MYRLILQASTKDVKSKTYEVQNSQLLREYTINNEMKKSHTLMILAIPYSIEFSQFFN